MVEGNITQEFSFENINEIRNYFIEEVNESHLKSRKHKKRLYGFKLNRKLAYFSFSGY